MARAQEGVRGEAAGADLEITAQLVLDDADTPFANTEEWAIRIANIVIAAVLLVLLSPLLLLIALAIKFTSPGPVLYRQTRVGLDRRVWGYIDRRSGSDRRKRSRKGTLDQSRSGRRRSERRGVDVCGAPFVMYKFRTMHVAAEAETGAVWAAKCDPRVTPIGGILRRSRLDELPQLWNVLLGDMNIVGPRPERPAIVEHLRVKIPEYALRQRTRPGITGLAQVNQPPDRCVDDVRVKVRYDLQYLRRRSLRLDLKILLKTPVVMFFRRNGW